jgi:hypothetical protein
MSRGALPRIFCALWVALLTVALLTAGPAGAATSAAGRWAGEIPTPDGKTVQIFLVLDQKDGKWTGALEDALLGSAPVSRLGVTGTSITFAFQPQGAPFAVDFSGTYIAGEDRVTGTFSQQGQSQFVKFHRVAATAAGAAAAGTDSTKAVPLPIRHPYRLAVTGRAAWWAAVHSVKDEHESINNLTSSAAAFDAAVKFYLLDGFALTGRGVRGGQGFTDDAARLAPYTGLGLGADSYISLDGLEFGVIGYLGNKVCPGSKLNPYFSGGAGWYDWKLTSGGRGTPSLAIEEVPVEGSNLGGWFGIGTEYALGRKLALDFEWAWRFFMTRDTKTWRNSEDVWGNTIAWGLSAGATVGF